MSDAALSLRNVTQSFGSTEIIRGVSLDITKGQRHAIIGPNGAGKTTLFNLISGRFPITSGEILLNDGRIDQLAPHQINRLGLSRSFQITSIFPKLSVFENLRCALLWSMGYRYSFWTPLWRQKELNERTLAILDDLNLLPRRDVAAEQRHTHQEYERGQQKRAGVRSPRCQGRDRKRPRRVRDR